MKKSRCQSCVQQVTSTHDMFDGFLLESLSTCLTNISMSIQLRFAARLSDLSIARERYKRDACSVFFSFSTVGHDSSVSLGFSLR